MSRLTWKKYELPPPVPVEDLDTLKPAAEIAHIANTGKIATAKCDHPLIPGLDADWCPRCRTWWVNQQLRDQLLTRKY